MENLRLTLPEFEDAETGEITPKVSAGQGKKIRIRPQAWNKDISEIKKLLPQYVIARKPTRLTEENQTMLNRKKEEFDMLTNKKA